MADDNKKKDTQKESLQQKAAEHEQEHKMDMADKNDQEANDTAKKLLSAGYKVGNSPNGGWQILNALGQKVQDGLDDSQLITFGIQVLNQPSPNQAVSPNPGAQPNVDGTENDATPDTVPQETIPDPNNPDSIPLFQAHPDIKAAISSAGESVAIDADGTIIVGDGSENTEIEPGEDGQAKADDIPLFKHVPQLKRVFQESGACVTVKKDGTVKVDGASIRYGKVDQSESEPQEPESSEASSFDSLMSDIGITIEDLKSADPENVLALIKAWQESSEGEEKEEEDEENPS